MSQGDSWQLRGPIVCPTPARPGGHCREGMLPVRAGSGLRLSTATTPPAPRGDRQGHGEGQALEVGQQGRRFMGKHHV